MKIEICCYNTEDAILAEKAGADRIEFCVERALDGISPSRKKVIEIVNKVQIPIYLMVRPRGGNFIYTRDEIKLMCDEISWAAQHGVSGFVFGCLDADNKIDIHACSKLLQAAKGFPCTFHRAFDLIEDKFEALDILMNLGWERVLTAGGIGAAADHIEILNGLVQHAKDNIIILPGGGIRPHHMNTILSQTQAKEIHSSDINIIVTQAD